MSHAVSVGSVIEGKIIKIKPFGAIVSIGDGLQGLVHISQISESFVQDINDIIIVGDIVKVKVLSVDEENKKITLSMKAVEGESKPRPQAGGDFGFQKQQKPGETTFDDKLKDWIKQSNERQAGINKRNNRR